MVLPEDLMIPSHAGALPDSGWQIYCKLLWLPQFLSTIIGGGMVYIAGALKDAKIDLAIAYQIMGLLCFLQHGHFLE